MITLKLKSLRKIYKFKNLIYNQQIKTVSSNFVFKYLKTFSMKYHIKHLLWHSPYSNLVLKTNLNVNLDNEEFKQFHILNFEYYLKFKNIWYMQCLNSYSLIFDFYSVLGFVNEDWSFVLLNTNNLNYNLTYVRRY